MCIYTLCIYLYIYISHCYVVSHFRFMAAPDDNQGWSFTPAVHDAGEQWPPLESDQAHCSDPESVPAPPPSHVKLDLAKRRRHGTCQFCQFYGDTIYFNGVTKCVFCEFPPILTKIGAPLTTRLGLRTLDKTSTRKILDMSDFVDKLHVPDTCVATIMVTHGYVKIDVYNLQFIDD